MQKNIRKYFTIFEKDTLTCATIAFIKRPTILAVLAVLAG